jgi:hypothetical protein
MTTDKLLEVFNEFHYKQRDVLMKKRQDYAQVDVLSNFKTAGAIVGVSSEVQALSMIAVKVARLGVLLNGKDAVNEPVEDSMLDLANYAFLLHAIHIENKEKAKDDNS